MEAEIIVIPKEQVKDVIRIISVGLFNTGRGEAISKAFELLVDWCNDQEAKLEIDK